MSLRKVRKKLSSTGPPGWASATRNGTGVHCPVRSISVKKPGRSGMVIEAPDRASLTIWLPRMSTSCWKSAAVVTGENRLHSMAKPSTAIRGLSLDTGLLLQAANAGS